MLARNWFSILIFSFLLLLYFYLLATPINLATADLGRHIINGQQLLSGNVSLLYKNYYSYTYPDFPFVNHHWLGGIIFYLVSIVSGFTGVQLLFVLINLIALGIFFYIAKKYSNIIVSSVTALLIIPVISYRAEVRPEVFSYMFAGIYYLAGKEYLSRGLRKKWFYLLPLLQLIWVNIHIYFFIGLFILGSFWLESGLEWLQGFKRGNQPAKNFINFTIVIIMSILVSFINPHFINGLLYPLQIYSNYGYRVLENQSVFFLENLIQVPSLLYFKIVLGLLILSWIYKIYRLIRFREKPNLAELVLSTAFSYLALSQIRNLALFGFFSLPIIAVNLRSIKLDMSRYLLFPASGMIFIFLLVINRQYWEGKNFGLGLAPGIEKGAEFFVKENLKGPIFNNYDIGGYLIYYLYPKEKVFADNRPEGYPVEFFSKTYLPMQEDESVWQAKSEEYNFNSILFYRHDLTPWAQKFLLARIKDPNWAPVFVDNYNIIFLKRNQQNAELIKKYEIPKEMFKFN